MTLQKPTADCFCGLRIESLDESGEQPRVLLVASGSIAEQAGLKEGDTLAVACGKEIASHEEALKLLRNAKGAVELRIRRAARGKSTRSIISSLLFGLRPLMSAVSGRTLTVMVSRRRKRSWWSCLTQRRSSQAQLTADV